MKKHERKRRKEEITENSLDTHTLPISATQSRRSKGGLTINGLSNTDLHNRILGSERLPKYGSLEPTGYISDLTNHAWILHYFPRYTWDYPELKAYRNMTDDRTFKLMHRGAGKSVSDVGIYTRKLVEGTQIGVVTAGSGMKTKLFRAMYYNLRSPNIRRDYGDILAKEFGGDTNKTMGYFVCAGNPDAGLDPDGQIITRGGSIIGSHIDELYFHDIIQEKFKSAESNDDLLITYDEVWQYCADWIGGCGTRKGIDDFYSHMQKRGFKFFYRHALKLVAGRWPTREDCEIMYIEDEITGQTTEIFNDVNTSVGTFESSGCPAWPLKKLLMNRIQNELAFESQMNNNPLARSGLVKWSDFQTYEVTYADGNRMMIDGHHLNNYLFVAFFDDASGESKDSDYRAVALMAKHKFSAKYYLVDCLVGHTKWIAKKKLDKIANFMRKKEKELGLRLTIYIEVVKNQRETYQNLRTRPEYSDLTVKDHNPRERGNKFQRILDNLVVEIEDHNMYIRNNMRFRAHLQAEVIRFGQKTHVDLMDAMDQAMHLLGKRNVVVHKAYTAVD